MTFVPPSNENLIDRLSRGDQMRYLHIRKAAEASATERPDLDHNVYTQFLHDSLIAAAGRNQITQATRQRGAQANVPVDTSALQKGRYKMEHDFLTAFEKNRLPAYGLEGRAAWEVLAKKVNGKPIPEKIISNVFDGDRGGIQIGGLIGGAIGLAVGYKLFGGFGGGLFGGIATVLSTIVASWAFNEGFHDLTKTMKNKLNPPATPNTPEVSPYLGTEPSTDPAKIAEASRKAVQTSSQPAPDASALGQLPPSPLPSSMKNSGVTGRFGQ